MFAVAQGIHLIKHAAWRTMERGGQFVLLGSAPDARVQVRRFLPAPHNATIACELRCGLTRKSTDTRLRSGAPRCPCRLTTHVFADGAFQRRAF